MGNDDDDDDYDDAADGDDDDDDAYATDAAAATTDDDGDYDDYDDDDDDDDGVNIAILAYILARQCVGYVFRPRQGTEGDGGETRDGGGQHDHRAAARQQAQPLLALHPRGPSFPVGSAQPPSPLAGLQLLNLLDCTHGYGDKTTWN